MVCLPHILGWVAAAALVSAFQPRPSAAEQTDLGAADPRLKGMQAMAGVRLAIAADFPAVANPRGLAFGADGDLFVMDAFGLKKLVRGKPEGPFEHADLLRPAANGSAVVVCDGVAFWSENDRLLRRSVSHPTGGTADERPLVRGLGTSIVSLAVGPDGWLYLQVGPGDHRAEGADGVKVVVLGASAVLRCRMDGTKLEVFAHGLRPYGRGMAFDRRFRLRMPQLMGTSASAPSWLVAEVHEGAHRQRALLPQVGHSQPPPPVASGFALLGDAATPAELRGMACIVDGAEPGTIRLLPAEAPVGGVGATASVLLQSAVLSQDGFPCFRPGAMAVGPDGALYVCDIQPVAASAGENADGKHGRIYRLTWPRGAEQSSVAPRQFSARGAVSKLNDGELLAALGAETLSARCDAADEAAKRGMRLQPELLKRLADSGQPLPVRLHAFSAVQRHWNEQTLRACMQQLGSDETELVRLAADALGRNAAHGDSDVEGALIKLITNPVPAVREAVALALGRVGGAASADALVNGVKFDDQKEPVVRAALALGLERLGELGLERLLALAESDRDEDRQQAVAAFALLTSRAACERLPRLLANPHLDDEQTAVLLRSCQNYRLDPPAPTEPALAWLAEHPTAAPAGKLAALESLAAQGALNSAAAHEVLLRLLKEETDVNVRLEAIRRASELRLQAAAPALLAQLADRDRPAAEQRALIGALARLQAKGAVPLLKSLLFAQEAKGLHEEAWEALGQLAEPSDASAFALSLLANVDARLQGAAAQIAGGTPGGAKRLAELFLEGKLARQTKEQVKLALERQGKAPKLSQSHRDELAELRKRVDAKP